MRKRLSSATRRRLARFGRALRRIPDNILISAINIDGIVGEIIAFPVLCFVKGARAIVPIASMDACNFVESVVVAPATRGTSVAPRHVSTEGADCYEIDFPAICYRKISNCWAPAESSVVFSNGRVLTQPTYDSLLGKIRYRNRFILHLTGRRAICAIAATENIRRGIYVSGDGCFNWYHWLIEILPKVMLAEELPAELRAYPILLPKRILALDTFYESVSVFPCARNALLLEEEITYKVNELIWIDSPVISPFANKPGKWPTAEDTRCHAGVLTKFRSRVLQALKIKEKHAGFKRIFLARPHDRRQYNQDEVSMLLLEFGVATVYPETLGFKEQVELFNSAELIIGPSGAAWANILFATSSSIGLCWTFPEYAKTSVFSNIAALVGMDLSYIWTPVPPALAGDLYIANYKVDLVELRMAMRQIIRKLKPAIAVYRERN